jgi:hypothetical protein
MREQETVLPIDVIYNEENTVKKPIVAEVTRQ